MHIWMVNHYALPPDQQGGTRHFSLAQKLVEQGHSVTIIACPYHYQQYQYFRDLPACGWLDETIDSVDFLWVKGRPYKGNGAGRLLNMMDFARHVSGAVRGAGTPSPDVVLASTPHLFAPMAAQKLARTMRVPFILEVRDLWPQSFYDLNILPRWHPLCIGFAIMERYLYSRADHIITLLNNSPSYLRDHGAGDVPITIMPNMVDAQTPMPEGKGRDGVFTFLYAGAHGVANGLDNVVDAAAILQSQNAPIRIACIGSGFERDRLIVRSVKEGLKNIVFRPAVPKSAIYAEMAKADAFVMHLMASPLFLWGISPNKLFDYMLMARPTLLCVDAPGNPIELSGGGLCRSSSDPHAMADAMMTLAQTPLDELNAMGKRARDYVSEHHNVSHGAAKIAQIATQLIEGKT